MKFNKWTVGLAAVGVVSLASAVKADEAATTSTVLTALSSTTLTGYVDVSAQMSFGGQNKGVNPPYTPGSVAGAAGVNGVNLNVVDIALDKPLDESQWAAGYHVELWYGPDAQGLGSDSIGVTFQDFAIRQAYIALRTPIGNGINWKIGVFDTIIGYESLTSYANPNFTHSYGFSLEPTTHTGILGSYQVNDMITVQAGVADTSYAGGYAATINGTGGFFGGNNGMANPTEMGSVAFTAPDSAGFLKGSSLYLGAMTTSGAAGAESYYLGLTLPTPSTALKLGFSFDYLDPHHSKDAWAVAGYATFQATDKLSLNVRGEYARNQGSAAPVLYFTKTEAEEITLTAQYDLWKNVVTRAEVRWDHSPSDSFVNNNGASFDNTYLMALNVIYKF